MSCDGLWQADAVADGRLSAKEPSFERHLRVCAECRTRLASNEKVRALVHDLAAETQPPDELHFRRLRARILRDAASPAPPGAGYAVPRIALGAAALGVVAILLTMKLGANPQRVAGVTAAEPSASAATGPVPTSTSVPLVDPPAASDVFAGSVTAVPGARWLQARNGGVERVSLLGGEIRVHVRKQAQDERFLVEVPDGEIEVRGTTFDVVVRDGSTRRVVVVEGVVQVRLRGRRELTLSEGQSWEMPTPTHQASTVTAAASPDESSDYEAATKLYRDGQFQAAADAFGRFEIDHPSSGTADDALYLQAVSLARAGRADASSAVAAKHLARFPQSFHRKDAAILVARAARAHGDCELARKALAPWLQEHDGSAARELGDCVAN